MERIEKEMKEIFGYQFRRYNLYDFLKIEKTDDFERIRHAHKKLTKFYHPDKNKSQNAADIFDKIQKVYNLLKDKDFKVAYDKTLTVNEDRQKKYNALTKERKIFADDLKKREEESKLKQREEFLNKKTQRRKFEEKEEKNFSGTPVKKEFQPDKEPLNEKLNKKSIIVKWKSNLDFEVNKDMIKAYFGEFGKIEEIILKENKNKAIIIYTDVKSTNEAILTQNEILLSLFEITRYKKESSTSSTNNIRSSNKHDELDDDLKNLIQNEKILKNVDFTINKEANLHAKTNTFHDDFDEFEKSVFSSFKK